MNLMLPVEVQQPNRPDTAVVVGYAPEEVSEEELIAIARIPDGCYLESKLMRSKKKGDRWSIVADVRIVKRGVPKCPHCHKEIPR